MSSKKPNLTWVWVLALVCGGASVFLMMLFNNKLSLWLLPLIGLSMGGLAVCGYIFREKGHHPDHDRYMGEDGVE